MRLRLQPVNIFHRSNKEFTKKRLENIGKQLNKVDDIKKKLDKGTDKENEEKLKKELLKLNKDINSCLTKYGMINLRTDGERMIIAQKYEKPANSGKWDIHKLEYSNDTGRFEVIDNNE